MKYSRFLPDSVVVALDGQRQTGLRSEPSIRTATFGGFRTVARCESRVAIRKTIPNTGAVGSKRLDNPGMFTEDLQ